MPHRPAPLPFVPVAAKPTAMAALASARSFIIDVPEATLVALKISGTHTDRHVHPSPGTGALGKLYERLPLLAWRPAVHHLAHGGGGAVAPSWGVAP